MNGKFRILTLFTITLFSGELLAQPPGEQKTAEYERVITLRAEKILKELSLADSAQFRKVQSLMVQQYKDLHRTEQLTDAARKNGDTASVRQTEQQLQELHNAYLRELAAELNEPQVEKIKDGMTYSVLPITYKAYLDMIPSLKSEEKEQIKSWLVDAREVAMDQGSSDKKHQVFGKYKGRINNYLSARGYDLQKERKAWEDRIKQQK